MNQEAGGGGGGAVSIAVPPGNASALISLAEELDAKAASLTALGTDLGRSTTDVLEQSKWTGDAASGYEAFARGTCTGVEGLAGPLHKIAEAIRAYAQKLESAQQSVYSAIDQADRAAASAAASAEQTLVSAAQQAASDAGSALSAAADAAAAEIGEAKDELDKVMEASEPVRAWLEKAHLPWDLGGGVAFDRFLAKPAEDAAEAGKQVKELWDSVESLAHEADNGLATWDEVDQLAARFSTLQDATKAFVPGWLETAGRFSTQLEGVSKAMGVLGIIGDAGTVWKPEDGGALGWVDRGAAVVNAGALGTELLAANALDEVPVVGEVVMVADVATGLYLGTDYVVHHWSGITHGVGTAANAVGHAAVSVAEDTGKAAVGVAKGVAHTATHVISDVTSWL